MLLIWLAIKYFANDEDGEEDDDNDNNNIADMRDGRPIIGNEDEGVDHKNEKCNMWICDWSCVNFD